MKHVLFLFAMFLILSESAYCQCPEPGLKIESAGCEQPKNLSPLSIACSEITVTWSGDKNQTYIVKAAGTSPATTSLGELKNSTVKCDSNGNCQATIFVKEGSVVSWSVQAVCVIENASLYSAEVKGKDVYIPHCQIIKESDTGKSLKLTVYPNPAPGYLVIEYFGKPEGIIEYRIYDISGKQVFTSIENALVKSTNRHKLNLHNLSAGTYTLEATHGNIVNRSKFVLLRK